MARSETTLPAAHELVAEAIQFGMPEGNRHGFQVIVERWLGIRAAQPKANKAAASKGKRIAWKAYSSMRGGSCGQCGDGANHWNNCGPHSSLCERCYQVLETSRKYWIPNGEFPSAD